MLKMNKDKDKIDQNRREFVKKSIKKTYKIPTLIILGQLLKPQRLKSDFGPPPSDPGEW